VDFCHVLTAAPEYQGRTFRTEIIVVPDYHGRFATTHGFATHQCKARNVITFAEGSFSGSPALHGLGDEVEGVYRNDPQKAVAVRVTARVEKAWFDQAPGVLPPRPGYVLRLLDADVGRLVDSSEDLLPPLPSYLTPEPSREEKPR
jgi:hypothetical protein